MAKRLYVGNISYQASENDLRELFQKAGEVVSAKLITDPATGRLRGFGFVEMSTDEAGDKAISTLDGNEFMGRKLVVREAKERPMGERRGPSRERGPRPGGRF
jgi:RNA recognition motif-containing protein